MNKRGTRTRENTIPRHQLCPDNLPQENHCGMNFCLLTHLLLFQVMPLDPLWLRVRIQHRYRAITNLSQPCCRVVSLGYLKVTDLALLRNVICLKKNSCHVFIQSKLKPRLSLTSFPAIRVSYVHLLGVLIGSLNCLRPL